MKINPKSSKPNLLKSKIGNEFNSDINMWKLDGSNQIYLEARIKLDKVTIRDVRRVSGRCVEESTSEMVRNCINHIIKKQDDILMRKDMEDQAKQLNKGKL